MIKKVRRLFLPITAITIFMIGLFIQKYLYGEGFEYSWVIAVAVMVSLGYLADKGLKKK